jgi:hypothetical protein
MNAKTPRRQGRKCEGNREKAPGVATIRGQAQIRSYCFTFSFLPLILGVLAFI